MPIRTRFNSVVRLGLLLLTAAVAGPAGAQNQTPANVPPRAGRTDVWKDPATGLIWAEKDNGSDVTQPQALNYCRNLSLEGFRDWLPEIDELAAIYDASVVSGQMILGGTNYYDLHVKGGIRMTGFGGRGATPGSRWGASSFNFFNGSRISFDVRVSSLRALCVRRAGE